MHVHVPASGVVVFPETGDGCEAATPAAGDQPYQKLFHGHGPVHLAFPMGLHDKLNFSCDLIRLFCYRDPCRNSLTVMGPRYGGTDFTHFQRSMIR